MDVHHVYDHLNVGQLRVVRCLVYTWLSLISLPIFTYHKDFTRTHNCPKYVGLWYKIWNPYINPKVHINVGQTTLSFSPLSTYSLKSFSHNTLPTFSSFMYFNEHFLCDNLILLSVTQFPFIVSLIYDSLTVTSFMWIF